MVSLGVIEATFPSECAQAREAATVHLAYIDGIGRYAELAARLRMFVNALDLTLAALATVSEEYQRAVVKRR